MSEFNYLTDQIAVQQINERTRTTRLSAAPGSGRGRRFVARRLHHLADRLEH